MNRDRGFLFSFFALVISFSLTMGSVSLAGNTTTVGTDSSFPAVAEVIGATPLTPGLFGDDTSGDVNGTLAQSFQLASPLDLKTIYIRYRNDSGSTGDLTASMSIFEVANINASTHANPPPVLDTVLSETVVFPEALSTSDNRIASIVLDSTLSLPANTGTEGYILHFTGNGDLEWYRTGSTVGNVYNFGQFYEDGDEKNGGERDSVFALSSELPIIPEPSSILLAGLAAFGLAAKRRRR